MWELQEASKEFLIESHENLDQLDADLVDLEKAPDPQAALGRIFRTLHTIKGSCSFLGFPHLEEVAHAGETLLGIGDGLGTDWLQYARHGAAVVVCSPSAQQLALTRRNFELRGLGGRFLHAAPASLPLESASIDVVCLSGLLEEVDDPNAVVEQ